MTTLNERTNWMLSSSRNSTQCSVGKWKSLSHVWLFATPWTVVHGIVQATTLECIAFPFSRRSSQPRAQTQVSHIASRFFTNWATREAQKGIESWLVFYQLGKSSLGPNKQTHGSTAFLALPASCLWREDTQLSLNSLINFITEKWLLFDTCFFWGRW